MFSKHSFIILQLFILLSITRPPLIKSYYLPTSSKIFLNQIDLPFDKSINKIHIDKSEIVPIGNKVLFQPFYWEQPDHGAYYKKITEHIEEFAIAGFDSMWLPPPSKTEVGDHAMGGYEPYDYYDLGEYDQKGRVRTHYGTRVELEDLIAEANSYGIGVISDIVINHRRGGEWEYNPYLGEETQTNFMNITSGKLKMNYTHFWPNDYGTGDSKAYGIFPDISHAHPYVRSELIKWGTWMRDEIGFDGWRFDTADGIDPTMLRDWMVDVSGWGVAERWMNLPDQEVLANYVEMANNTVSAFDIDLLVELRDMANQRGNYDMRHLTSEGLISIKSESAVTYAVNHDTYRDIFNIIKPNRHMAYAFILTHEGYPSVFWMDWVDLNLRNHLRTLVHIHNNYAKGSTSVLHTDEDLYIAQRNGDPGLIIGINDHPTDWKTVTVTTKWTETILNDLTGQSPNSTVDSTGETTLSIPPTGYAVFSTDEPLVNLFDVPNTENYQSPKEISTANILIDGELDYSYGRPFYMDNLNDGMLTPADLTNLYLKHDNENLYISFGYYNLNKWDSSTDVHYGIALDVTDGGSTEDPGIHPKIRWSALGSSKKPDILYYLETASKADDYKRVIDTITRFEFNSSTETWNSETDASNSAIQYVSSELLGLIELKIPLKDIKMENGGSLRIKVFSTIEDFEGAFDSVPQDNTIDLTGDTISWLTMPEQVNLTIDQGLLTSRKITTSSVGDYYFGFLIILGIFCILGIFYRKRF